MAKKKINRYGLGCLITDTFFSDPEASMNTIEGISKGANFAGSLPVIGGLFKGAAGEVGSIVDPMVQEAKNEQMGMNNQQMMSQNPQASYIPNFYMVLHIY